jgi:hypothetical protein
MSATTSKRVVRDDGDGARKGPPLHSGVGLGKLALEKYCRKNEAMVLFIKRPKHSSVLIYYSI